jgi:hypothetical protein
MRIRSIFAAAALGLAATSLAGCATGLSTKVSRLQAMPAPQGQSFYVVPAGNVDAGGLEFRAYAAQVAQAMQAYGYAPAVSPQSATMIVNMSYGVSDGQTEVRRDPFSRYNDPFYSGYYGYGRYYGRPYYSRWSGYGARSPFYYGWNDPFWYGSGSGLEAYTTYRSFLDLDIRRRADNVQLFDGTAQARSTTDNLNALVPNLVEAMFTGFPGRSGETIRITVPPQRR